MQGGFASPAFKEKIKKKMSKKNYMVPDMELVELQTPTLLSASAGPGINDDYSTSSDNDPDPEQPTGW